MQNILRWFFLSLLVTAQAQANVVGADTQNFNPTPDGLDFVTVHSSETLEPGVLNFGLFFNYAINSLPNYESKSLGSRTNFTDSLLSADLNFGFGIMRNWQVGISFPQLISQKIESDMGDGAEFARTGLTEIRASTKYRFFGDQEGGLAAILSVNSNQIEDNPFAGEGAGPTYNIELAWDTTINRFNVGFNAGYRWRQPGEQLPGIPVEPLPNQIIASGAVSYLLTSYDTKLIAEIFSSFPTESQESATDRELSSAELLVGVKSDINTSMAVHAGGGTEIYHGTSSPDWRLYIGLNYTLGPLFPKPTARLVRVREDESPTDAMLEQELNDALLDEPPQARETFIAKDVLFAFNSDQLSPEFQDLLKRMADYLKRNPNYKMVTIEGHTDSIGRAEYNLDLSLRRAQSVRKYLIQQGLKASNIKAIGRGEERPIADNGNYQGRALNRRVEFKIER